MGGAKQDEAPIGHTATYPCCHKENRWRKHHHQVHLADFVKATARQLNEPCDSLAVLQKNEKMRTKIMDAKCNASYLFWESPCRYLTFIWHFEMLMKCNANISIPGAMPNVNEMQMKCKCNANEM